MGELIEVFEHTVEFSTGSAPSDAALSGRLREGLRAFAMTPEKFIDGLERSEVQVLGDDGHLCRLSRRLDFGNFAFEEKVLLREGDEFLESVAATEQFPASTFRIRMEPLEDSGFVMRFTYRQDAAQWPHQTEQIAQIRTDAWKSKDIGWLRRVLGDADFKAYSRNIEKQTQTTED